MQTRLVGLAFLVSLAALTLAAYAVVATGPDATPGARIDELEARLERLEASVRAGHEDEEPTLVGHGGGTGGGTGGPGLPPQVPSVPGGAVTADALRVPDAAGPGQAKEQLRELVDEAVEKKAAQIRSMQDKKPSIDVFAKTLGLSEAQREIVEREVVAAQHEIRRILETPTEDGTNLLGELVEVLAEGMARPGEKSERGMRWFGRVLTEQVPGTSETYAAQAERAKTRLRETLRRELSEEQHALYEAWQMDPSEIEEVPGSPWKDVEARVIQRAKDLGAEIPADR